MVLDPTVGYVMLVIFVATLVRSTLGFGEALVAVPLLALRIPLVVATPLAVLFSVVVATMIIAQDWRQIQLRSAGGLILSSLVGIPLGLMLLAHGNAQMVKLILAGVLMSFSVYSLTVKATLHLERDRLPWLLGAGLISGVLGGAFGMNGPPLAIYGALRRWSPQHFRATLQGYFLPVSLAGLIGFASIGLWGSIVTRYFLFSLPGAVAATLIGRVLNRRLQGDGFFRSVYAGLMVIAAVLAIQALQI
ncbi:MAG TPA: sulfite exporter TauE/SafE family protein [Gemmatimonadales bacterium]|jgi:hypothetical protein